MSYTSKKWCRYLVHALSQGIYVAKLRRDFAKVRPCFPLALMVIVGCGINDIVSSGSVVTGGPVTQAL